MSLIIRTNIGAGHSPKVQYRRKLYIANTLPFMSSALDALDIDALVRDVAALVQVPSVTGDERAALELFTDLAHRQGLESTIRQHDLTALRAHPDHPGEEASRDSLFGATATLPGTRPGRIAL